MELKQIVTSMEQLHQRLEQASSVELTIPYTVTTYTDDDEKLYQNGRTGEISFTLHLPETVAPEASTHLTTLREGDQGEAVFCPAGATDSPGILIRKLRGLR